MEDNENTSSWVWVFGIGIAVGLAVILALAVVVLAVGLAVSPAGVMLTPQAGAQAAPPTPAPVRFRASVPDASAYTWVTVASGFDNPLLVTHAGDGSGRLFGVEQTGRVWIIKEGVSYAEPFLDISELLSPDVFMGAYTERGLLGLAFHPDYENNGIFFVSYTDVQGDSRIARYQVSQDDPDKADPDSGQIILAQDQPWQDHNGGNIVFGPDGYLYIGFGDGGNVNVPNYNGQDPTTFLAKILRIDVNADPYAIPPDNPFVNNPDFKPEIWALGVRNPWRFSFDRATGDLYIGDVGQLTWEEVNFAEGNPGGLNYGWSAWEATHPYLTDVTPISDVTMPFFEYGHDSGNSVTGGYVYRGAALPELNGIYFFGDYGNGRVWAAYRNPAGAWQTLLFMETGRVITSFGEDESGELYLVDYKGDILRLERKPQ